MSWHPLNKQCFWIIWSFVPPKQRNEWFSLSFPTVSSALTTMVSSSSPVIAQLIWILNLDDAMVTERCRWLRAFVFLFAVNYFEHWVQCRTSGSIMIFGTHIRVFVVWVTLANLIEKYIIPGDLYSSSPPYHRVDIFKQAVSQFFVCTAWTTSIYFQVMSKGHNLSKSVVSHRCNRHNHASCTQKKGSKQRCFLPQNTPLDPSPTVSGAREHGPDITKMCWSKPLGSSKSFPVMKGF